MENMGLALIIFILFFFALYWYLFINIIGKKIDKRNGVQKKRKNG